MQVTSKGLHQPYRDQPKNQDVMKIKTTTYFIVFDTIVDSYDPRNYL